MIFLENNQPNYLTKKELISHLLSDEELPLGVALITVIQFRENYIVVASGANAKLFLKYLHDTQF